MSVRYRCWNATSDIDPYGDGLRPGETTQVKRYKNVVCTLLCIITDAFLLSGDWNQIQCKVKNQNIIIYIIYVIMLIRASLLL